LVRNDGRAGSARIHPPDSHRSSAVFLPFPSWRRYPEGADEEAAATHIRRGLRRASLIRLPAPSPEGRRTSSWRLDRRWLSFDAGLRLWRARRLEAGDGAPGRCSLRNRQMTPTPNVSGKRRAARSRPARRLSGAARLGAPGAAAASAATPRTVR
jgi:hypothetical protein